MKKCGASACLHIVIDPTAHSLFEDEMLKTMLCISDAAPHLLYFYKQNVLPYVSDTLLVWNIFRFIIFGLLPHC